jgi:hypothetical protein
VTDSFSAPRRQFLHSAALTAGSIFLSGCLRRIPTHLPSANPAAPLTIDIHCHFFNGTDLQMQRFLQTTQGASHPGAAIAAPVAQYFNWKLAPTGKAEMRKLRSGHMGEKEAQKKWDKARSGPYGKFRHEVLKHRAEAALTAGGTATQGSSPSRAPEWQSNRWPKKYKKYKDAEPHLVGGGLPAFKEYFQYRYVALDDYLDLYNGATKRSIDLAIAHLVDYDWPLNDGEPPRTPLHVQVKLMERISALSLGRIHTFAPFDPFREIAYRAGIRGAKWSALDALKQWVTRFGCIGVKIYPPMGFAPYGNCEIDVANWSGRWKWLSDVKSVPDGKGGQSTIGERLDDVLAELYCWCLSIDLPVMAHTDLSNGLSETFNQFPAAKYWGALRECFGGLRVNFGHLGDFEKTTVDDWSMLPATSPSIVNARDLVALMSADSSAPGGRFFADSAYQKRVLTEPNCLREVYRAALSWKAPGQSRPVLQDRIMYGSDWSLVMLETDMEKYFADFVSMYLQLDASLSPSDESTKRLSCRFFGENAVDYLGLRDGCTRKRLTKFYDDRGVTFSSEEQPAWMRKIES